MIKASSLVLAAFAAGMVAQPSSASTPTMITPAVVQPSPAAVDMLKGMFQDAHVSIEPAKAFSQYFRRSFCRFPVPRAAP